MYSLLPCSLEPPILFEVYDTASLHQFRRSIPLTFLPTWVPTRLPIVSPPRSPPSSALTFLSFRPPDCLPFFDSMCLPAFLSFSFLYSQAPVPFLPTFILS